MSDKKGKPTPKRKEAQAKLNISSLSPAASKDAKKSLKAQARVRRLETRAAYMRGEEGALPVRDKGPARRFVRDYVDARKSVTEYFLVIIMFVLFLTLIPLPAVQLGAIAIMYSAMLWIGIDGFVFSRKIKKAVAKEFPGGSTKGLGLYGWMRSTQLRRLRAPAPQARPGVKK